MITASLADFHRYLNLHPQFQTVEAFLKSYIFGEPGERVYIDGEKLFAIPALDQAKAKENAPLEAHNRYIDIQVCLEGHETMGWRSRSDCHSPKSTFDTAKDILFFDDKPLSYFDVPAGSFAIFFPEDCHAPLIGEGIIKKIIFKVEV
jgi:YhcH/YjgK/YiaL family protein